LPAGEIPHFEPEFCGSAAKMGESDRMDRIDRKILDLFQHDTRRIADSIGAEVGLSPAAVQRRLKRLRENGTIRAEVACLDGRSVGVPIACVVLVTMVSRAGPAASLDRFRRRMRDLPQVQQCYQVTGPSDIVLIVSAGSMEEYGAFARQWFEGNEEVARYETLVVIDRVKVGLSLPLAPDEAPPPHRRPRRNPAKG
jgi:Lrp/AsnC family leucine-responsive transcriptional regulator